MRSYFIIEKDSNTINCIREVLSEYPDLLYTGSGIEYETALNHVLKYTPDIVFIDIDSTLENLPNFVFDVTQYGDRIPFFIALSSKKLNAYNAYQYDFSDFILKPLTNLYVRKSILKCLKKLPETSLEVICLKSNKDYRYIPVKDILFLKADNNTTDFHLKDNIVISAYKTLKTFEDKLPKYFFRIHKSYIINSRYISRIHYGKNICVIKDLAQKIPFTKTFIKNINLINEALVEKTKLVFT